MVPAIAAWNAGAPAVALECNRVSVRLWKPLQIESTESHGHPWHFAPQARDPVPALFAFAASDNMTSNTGVRPGFDERSRLLLFVEP
jgi:hypothetical protein